MGLYDTRTNRRSFAKTIDWWLLGCYFTLVLIGILNIYASVHSIDGGNIFDPDLRSGKQMIWLLISLGVGSLVLFAIPPRVYEGFSLPLYLIMMALLVAVIFLSHDVKGSHSWFSLGPVSFQPAELSKTTTSLMLATLMSQVDYRIGKPKDFLLTAAVILVPMLTIVAQKETGSALVYCGYIFMLYREGLSGWFLITGGMAILIFILTLTASPYAAMLVLTVVVMAYIAVGERKTKLLVCIGTPVLLLLAFTPAAFAKIGEGISDPESFFCKLKPVYVLAAVILTATPFILRSAYRNRRFFNYVALAALIAGIGFTCSVDFIFNNILQDHQRSRIEVLLGMRDDPAGVGYNVNQSMIAIGSGGVVGKGYLQGTQTTYGFVPEQSTDFIFCTIGEEWGFLGSAAVVLLYAFMICRIIIDSEHSREAFTRIYGYCFAGCIFMHLFINVGMTIGLMPVIGIPLPFISYGGSSLLSFSLMFFIFMALDKNERKYF